MKEDAKSYTWFPYVNIQPYNKYIMCYNTNINNIAKNIPVCDISY